jgi:hypothetical protein
MLTALQAPAQSHPDSSSSIRPQREQAGQQFHDEDGDGVDDRVAWKGKAKRGGKDRFVDRDNDGICDDRASGLGFRRGTGGFRGGSGSGIGTGGGIGTGSGAGSGSGKGKGPGGR